MRDPSKGTGESPAEAASYLNLFLHRAGQQRRTQYQYVQTKLHLLGIIGLFGFPSYWLIWTYAYPQPYENLWLRLLGAVASVPFIIERWLSPRLKSLMPIYGFIFCTLALPAFFSFMSLMNGANMIWQTSFVAAFLYLALILDAFYFVVSALLGTGIGITAFLLLSASGLPSAFVDTWPVYLFVLSAGGIFNYADALVRAEDRIKAARAVGGTIAHEMRTPLLGIRLDAAGARERLSGMLESLADQPTPPMEGQSVVHALQRIESHSQYAETALNLMLANLAGPRGDPAEMQDLSMAELVNAAIDRFPFRGGERAKLKVDLEADFRFRGSPILMTQVIHNLLRNALRAIAEARTGEVTIWLDRADDGNRLVIRDTGIGIPADRLSELFRPFATMWSGSRGVGLGLAFCKKAVEDMRGTITAASRYGSFTQFTITFPVTFSPNAAS